MNINKIEQLICLLDKYKLKKIKIKYKNTHIEICKNYKHEIKTNNQIKESNYKNTKTIKAPLAGRFYLAMTSKNKKFITEGSRVKKGDTLCTIESMKIFHNIKSEYNGKINKILPKNKTLVEYEQTLFILENV